MEPKFKQILILLRTLLSNKKVSNKYSKIIVGKLFP